MIEPLKDGLKHAAKWFGYEIVRADWMQSAVFAAHLRALFEKLRIDCVLDVGANRGQYRHFLRKDVDYRGWIVSFEPLRANVEVLNHAALSDPLWAVCGFALGQHDGSLDLNVMEVDTFSSFLLPDHSGVSQFNDENVVHHVQRAEVKRLDGVLRGLRQMYPIKNVYLKMDTQGFDLNVIEGAGAELRGVRALQTELALKRLYMDMPGYEEVLRTLHVKGFDVSGVFPVSSDENFRAIECDCVMVNRGLSLEEGRHVPAPAERTAQLHG